MSLGERLDQQLAEFRASHRVRRLLYRGAEWRYYCGGSGGEAVLFLTGALGAAEFAFQQIALLEPHYRVIAPDYPPVGTLGALADGLVAVLDAEDVERAHVVGGSFGGVVAQGFVRRAPSRVVSLVLSHTGAPDAPRGRTAAVVGILSRLPTPLLRAALRRRLGRTLASAGPFWRRRFDEAVGALSKADIVSRIRLATELRGQVGAAAPDSAHWAGPVLIIEAEDDPLVRPGAQAALRALYPRAEIHRFHGTGHAAGILRPDEFAAVLLRFLAAA
jgi:aminoacrylate hydrolase